MNRPKRRRVAAIDDTCLTRRALLPSERLRPVIVVGPNKMLGLDVVTFEVLP